MSAAARVCCACCSSTGGGGNGGNGGGELGSSSGTPSSSSCVSLLCQHCVWDGAATCSLRDVVARLRDALETRDVLREQLQQTVALTLEKQRANKKKEVVQANAASSAVLEERLRTRIACIRAKLSHETKRLEERKANIPTLTNARGAGARAADARLMARMHEARRRVSEERARLVKGLRAVMQLRMAAVAQQKIPSPPPNQQQQQQQHKNRQMFAASICGVCIPEGRWAWQATTRGDALHYTLTSGDENAVSGDEAHVSCASASAALGYTALFVSLFAKYADAPLLCELRFHGSRSTCWERASFFDARPLSQGLARPLYRPPAQSGGTEQGGVGAGVGTVNAATIGVGRRLGTVALRRCVAAAVVHVAHACSMSSPPGAAALTSAAMAEATRAGCGPLGALAALTHAMGGVGGVGFSGEDGGMAASGMAASVMRSLHFNGSDAHLRRLGGAGAPSAAGVGVGVGVTAASPWTVYAVEDWSSDDDMEEDDAALDSALTRGASVLAASRPSGARGEGAFASSPSSRSHGIATGSPQGGGATGDDFPALPTQRRKSTHATDAWAMVEFESAALPPPPSRVSDVIHWERAVLSPDQDRARVSSSSSAAAATAAREMAREVGDNMQRAAKTAAARVETATAAAAAAAKVLFRQMT